MVGKEEELARLRRARNDDRQNRLDEDSKRRLKEIAAKKFRTCFIFSLAEFESTFGLEIWGHDMPEEDITPEQAANRLRWEQVRKNILDKGNAQARALGMEIDSHNIRFNRYRMDFGGKNNGI